MDRELTPKQQTSEAIRQAESILIMTGQHPTVDQVASTIALAAILRKFGKKVTAVVSDELPVGARFLPTKLVDREMGGLRDFIVQVGLDHAEVDKLKYTIENGKLNIHISPFAGGFRRDDVSFSYGDYHFDLVIVLGVASYSRIDKAFIQNQQMLQDIPLANIDFHRSNEQYGAINLIDSAAASLGEILMALSESLQTGLIDTEIATTILAGIMAATDRFTATHTTAKSMTVAAQMMAMGADQQQVVKGLYRDRDTSRRQGQSQPTNQNQRRDRAESRPQPRPMKSDSDRNQGPQPSQPVREAQPTRQPIPQPSSQSIQSAPVQTQAPTSASRPNPIQPDSRPTVTPASPHSDQLPRSPLESRPVAESVSQTSSSGAPELETDGPAVTDPDTQSAQGANQPEPLLNDNSDNDSGQTQASKNSNPTNNPIFANRLP